VLETIDLDLSVPEEEFRRRMPALQARLYDLEHAIFTARVPVAVVFEGWAAAGKGSTINLLTRRLDARGFRVVPVTPPRTAELRYPWLHRFWLQVPARGQMVMFDTSWYRRVLIERIDKTVRKRDYELAFQDIVEFEEALAADGAILVKFWFHITKKEQGRRFKKLLKDPLTTWQVSQEDHDQHRDYDRYLGLVEEMLARTDMPYASWTIVPATDSRFTRVKVFETLVKALETRVGAAAPRAKAPAPRRTARKAPAPRRTARAGGRRAR
jgi:polyphosphate kinase 2 (PPK2 family)